MLLIQTEEAVAYKPTLARSLARNRHYGVGEGRCGGCEPSIVRRRSFGRTTSSRQLVLYSYTWYIQLRFVAVSLCLVQPTRFSRLAEHARHLGGVAPLARGRKGCARRGGTCWWAMLGWLDANFELNEYCCCVRIRCHVPGTCTGVFFSHTHKKLHLPTWVQNSYWGKKQERQKGPIF